MPDKYDTSETWSNSRVGVFLLAAGSGTRMGESKPLMDFDGNTILDRMVGAFRAAGLTGIHVIGRAEDHELAAEAIKAEAAYIVNPRPDLEMAGSVLVALEHCDAQWACVCPADMPLLTREAISECVAVLDGDIVQPSVDGRAKHPVFLHERLFPKIRARLLDGRTLRDCLSELQSKTLVPLKNSLQFRDVDTPDDVQDLLR